MLPEAAALNLGDGRVGLVKRLVHDIRRVNFGPKSNIKLLPCQAAQILAISFQLIHRVFVRALAAQILRSAKTGSSIIIATVCAGHK